MIKDAHVGPFNGAYICRIRSAAARREEQPNGMKCHPEQVQGFLGAGSKWPQLLFTHFYCFNLVSLFISFRLCPYTPRAQEAVAQYPSTPPNPRHGYEWVTSILRSVPGCRTGPAQPNTKLGTVMRCLSQEPRAACRRLRE